MMRKDISKATLAAIQFHFHELIRSRVAELVGDPDLSLPDLQPLLESNEEEPAWFPVEGMYGGFAYRLEGDGDDAVLIVESWCRVIGGSGQDHEVTATGFRLIRDGTV